MFKDSIGDRIKQYENCYRIYLPHRSAVIVRIDGKSFHSFTKGFARPYDILFASCMQETAKNLCENVGGCKFGYTQSDEITLILTDYENINTEPWFGNNLQKIVSISASMATFFFRKNFEEAMKEEYFNWYISLTSNERTELMQKHNDAYDKKLCVFDSRAFIVPREEIFNVLYWRQLDCKRNSIQLLGQANFSHNQLQNKNSDEIQEMLWQEKGINWAKEPEWFKNGVAIYRKPVTVINHLPNNEIATAERNRWYIDLNTPVFTKDRSFIEKHITFNNE